MRALSIIVTLVALAGAGVITSSCHEHEGPAQKAGEKIDRATDKVSDTLDPKGPAEKAGRSLDRATGHD